MEHAESPEEIVEDAGVRKKDEDVFFLTVTDKGADEDGEYRPVGNEGGEKPLVWPALVRTSCGAWTGCPCFPH